MLLREEGRERGFKLGSTPFGTRYVAHALDEFERCLFKLQVSVARFDSSPPNLNSSLRPHE